MKDDDYFNLLCYERYGQTVRVKNEPEEILGDVDPVIIADMKARLKGGSPPPIYDVSDRVVDETLLVGERNKLRQIFDSESKIREAFSSIKNIKATQTEISFKGIDKKTLSDYAYLCSKEESVDEVDFYRSFLFGIDLITKQERLERWNRQTIFDEVLANYSMGHFDTVKLTMESIQMSKPLTSLFRDRRLSGHFDGFLFEFYGIGL